MLKLTWPGSFRAPLETGHEAQRSWESKGWNSPYGKVFQRSIIADAKGKCRVPIVVPSFRFPGSVAAPCGSCLVLSSMWLYQRTRKYKLFIKHPVTSPGQREQTEWVFFCFVLAFFQLWSSKENMKRTLSFQLSLRNKIRICPSTLPEKHLSSSNSFIRIRGEAESKWSLLVGKKNAFHFSTSPPPGPRVSCIFDMFSI